MRGQACPYGSREKVQLSSPRSEGFVAPRQLVEEVFFQLLATVGRAGRQEDVATNIFMYCLAAG